MSVELPKDAEGREIPLDTETLYDKNGERLAIYAWEYRPKLKRFKWTVHFLFDESGDTCYPDEYFLTTPDTWEKLEEDLGRGADALNYEACAYFGKSACDCSSCIADLIDRPTCTIVHSWQEITPGLGELELSDMCGFELSCGHEVQGYEKPKYCSECGAVVLNED